jgi:hypothetical protein
MRCGEDDIWVDAKFFADSVLSISLDFRSM